jgi:hypothetical protein
MASTAPDRQAPCAINRALRMSMLSGFSQSTCTRRRRKWSAISGWVTGGVQTITASSAQGPDIASDIAR